MSLPSSDPRASIDPRPDIVPPVPTADVPVPKADAPVPAADAPVPVVDGSVPAADAADTTAQASPVLTAHGIKVRYTADGPLVLDGLDLCLEAGRFYLLSGPSGGGKSTLLSYLNGTLSVGEGGLVEGQLTINGEQPPEAASARAHLVGSVLQDANSQILFEKVEDELAFPLENLNIPPEEMHRRVPHTAATVRLSINAATATLSGGQKQRLTTAATLAMGQRILLFDEPLASLDSAGADLLLGHLRRLVDREGYTILFIEHRIDWVLPYADRSFWLENGKAQSFQTAADFEAYFSKTVIDRLTVPAPLPPVIHGGEPLIVLEKASFRAGGRIILNEIDFVLHRGERKVIHGENGTGKTTFLHLLAGLIRPTSGTVSHVWGRRDRFRRVGVVMQDPDYQLFLPTVADELSFQAYDRATMEKLIELFDFAPLLERHPHSLSEGQKRRLGFAVILSMLPEVLFLDEPTVGQDYVSLYKLLNALSEIYRDRPLTLLTLTHDDRCGSFFGDDVLYIRDGRLAEGEP